MSALMQPLFAGGQQDAESIDFRALSAILLAGKEVDCTMYRIFVGLELPTLVTDQLARISCGLPGARWIEPKQMHITLRFIGEVDGGVFDDALNALDTVSFDPLELQLKGVGFFPPRGRAETLWVGVPNPEPLSALKTKIDASLARAGIEREQRKFVPHVAIARLRDCQSSKLGQYIVEYSLFESAPFQVERFHLYSSALSSSGAIYRIEGSYSLGQRSSTREKPS
ncbi:MAG: RNA 2',3'-cyclic phosphodiesterase [candidate division Zixibacteria bacterium]|nr:RNA 2',3'-cyclic phosphodiesterase [candidate division Zixibacteria bacterium]